MSNIYFEVQTKSANHSERADKMGSVVTPSQLPGFVLCHNDNWEDNNYYNWYALHYFGPSGEWVCCIGELRIMHKDGQAPDHLPQSFSDLPDEYCSMGNNSAYYTAMHNVLGTELAMEVLRILHDCAVNVDIYEQYKNDDQFRGSLWRESFEAERTKRTARYCLNGVDINQAYNFEYIFHPEYNRISETSWKVEFKTKARSFERYVGVIGENGVGKTQMMSSFIRDFQTQPHSNNFLVRPIFSEIVAICSTPFDEFMAIDSARFDTPYIKCCLQQDKVRTIDEICECIDAIKRRGEINGSSLMSLYVENLRKLLPTEGIMDVFYHNGEKFSQLRVWNYDCEALKYMVNKLSSGQLQLMVLMTHVFRYVQYDSLLVLDEPEVHLHPNGIMNFFSLLDELLQLFQSYAVVLTHSPIVIREMIGRNVYTLRRLPDNTPYIEDCSDEETLGCDISSLYRHTFNFDELTSCFRKLVSDRIDEGKSFDEIIESFGLENMSLNSQFIIRNMLKAKESKNHDAEN